MYNMREYNLHTVYFVDGIPARMVFEGQEDWEDWWYDEMGLHYTQVATGLRHHIPMHRIARVTTFKDEG